MALDNLFGDRQAHAGAGVLGMRVQALEDHENPIRIQWIDANPVVAHGKAPIGVPVFGRDVNAWRLGAVKLQCVPNQVLEHLGKLRGIAPNRRQGIVGYCRSRFRPWRFAGS